MCELVYKKNNNKKKKEYAAFWPFKRLAVTYYQNVRYIFYGVTLGPSRHKQV